MALMTHQIQGSYTTFPVRSVSRNRGIESKQFGITLPVVGMTDRHMSLQHKYKPFLSVGAPLSLGPKANILKISSFKGVGQNEESCGSRAVESKYLKNSVKLSYVRQESEETLKESPTGQNVSSSSSASAADETTERSQASQNLLRKWLTLLRTPPSPNQAVEETSSEETSSREMSETQKNQTGEILRTVWCYFLGLDAMIKIPLLIIIPSFMGVTVVYGAEVSKELTPLWVLGPFIVALYIKMMRAIFALYVFGFKQTVSVVRNLPTYTVLVYNYIASGKLKEHVRAYTWQPVVDVKNMNYKEVMKAKMKEFNGWLYERYLDFVESIWPVYCRLIRFLKRANLI